MPSGPDTHLLSVRLTPLAEQDLEDIWLFTARTWSPSQADRYIDGLATVFDLICAAPEMARERDDIMPPVRLHRHKSHLIIYRIEPPALLIIRVVHIKAQWQAVLGDFQD